MTTNESSVSRRELLRRGAALGAAVAVTGPLVQGLGQVAAFAQGSPPPDDGGPAEFPSHIQLLFTVTGSSTVYGIAWNRSWDRIGRGASCWPVGTYEHHTAAHRAVFAQEGTIASVVTGGRGSYQLDAAPLAAAGITITDARAFDGQHTGGTSGKCSPPITPSGTVYTFSKP